MAPTWLPGVRSVSLRSEIGHMAVSDKSGSSFLSDR